MSTWHRGGERTVYNPEEWLISHFSTWCRVAWCTPHVMRYLAQFKFSSICCNYHFVHSLRQGPSLYSVSVHSGCPDLHMATQIVGNTKSSSECALSTQGSLYGLQWPGKGGWLSGEMAACRLTVRLAGL